MAEETAVELVEPDKSELSEPAKRSTVEEELTVQSKAQQGKWVRRALMATGTLAILYLAWEYILPLLSLWIHL